ncbi:hypothetical protein MKQ70_30530 [Chitinophaga sedimenti]|uniref:hypothetical protein n=1 Tax=Chitinophaga sedimenti TaxID=2033606 RepID=UPI00200588D9|nr:hypothetical protein [Chitinophaga sedimenti]MCK7559081.1 hypothetical protein [Chitinophaga sedimenti]
MDFYVNYSSYLRRQRFSAFSPFVNAMSYKDYFSEEQLKDYEVVSEWNSFYEKLTKGEPPQRIYTSKYITNKIFALEVDIKLTVDCREDFTFKNCYFEKGITFKGSKFQKKFWMIDCIVKGALSTFDSPSFARGLLIINSSVEQILIFKGSYGESRWDIKNVSKLSISGGVFTDLNISLKGKIGHIGIIANQVEGDIFIDGSNQVVQSINLSGTAKKCHFSSTTSKFHI